MASDALAVVAGEAQAAPGGTEAPVVDSGDPWRRGGPESAEPERSQPRGHWLLERLFEPVDISSLVYYRIAFGAIMLWEVVRYVQYGWIASYFIVPTFHFTYFGFDWVRPWPGVGMYMHFAALGALAVCIVFGICYRVAAAAFFLGFTYVFLLEQARYLNHFYLVGLISFVMIFVPAHRALSVDAWSDRSLRSAWAPTWALWLLRFQIAVPYFFGGIAKLNADWLQGEPLRAWLAGRASLPVLGPLLTHEWAAYLFSYGGLLIDLSIVPLLLWRRTRWIGLALAVVFNVLNALIFSIGIFPWLMIASTLLFFEPDWPRRLVARLLGWFGRYSGRLAPEAVRPPRPSLGRPQYAIAGLLAVWVVLQLLVPLRHHLYPGDVAWTEEGHRFSWRMKLRDKQGAADFLATDPGRGLTWRIDPREYVTSWQLDEMAARPDMVIQLAHRIADDMRRRGYQQIEVRARVYASLNGRWPQALIDPTVDLTTRERSLLPADWIVPLSEPLRR